MICESDQDKSRQNINKAEKSGMETTEDSILSGKVKLTQPQTGYRVAVDPILLAAFTEPKRGANVAELGCGTGAAMLALALRRADVTITGLEVQQEIAEIAHRNVQANEMGDRLSVHVGDLRELPTDLSNQGFDALMMNPPYLDPARHRLPSDASLARSHAEGEAKLEDWIAACRRLLKSGGLLTIIHRADRIDGLMQVLKPGFGGIVICPIWSKSGENARRVLVMARKDRHGAARILSGLVLHNADGTYTSQTQSLLEGGNWPDLAKLIS